MRDATSSSHPPRWTHALLRLALPCDPMRDAILGDLHEEFQHDVMQLGVERAHRRHLSRVVGIVSHILSDTATFRSWGSSEPPIASVRAAEGAVPGAIGPVVRHRRNVFGDASFAALAVFVIAVSVVANTMLYSATQAHATRLSFAAGLGGVALLVACVAIAAIAICAGPRWLRNRARRA